LYCHHSHTSLMCKHRPESLLSVSSSMAQIVACGGGPWHRSSSVPMSAYFMSISLPRELNLRAAGWFPGCSPSFSLLSHLALELMILFSRMSWSEVKQIVFPKLFWCSTGAINRPETLECSTELHVIGLSPYLCFQFIPGSVERSIRTNPEIIVWHITYLYYSPISHYFM
jgi:hypothetical protein